MTLFDTFMQFKDGQSRRIVTSNRFAIIDGVVQFFMSDGGCFCVPLTEIVYWQTTVETNETC